MKVLVVFGTRPEVIKLAPVIAAAKEVNSSQLQLAVCATGQHREMQQQAMTTFAIKPDFSLDLMELNQTLAKLTSNLMHRMTETISSYEPDWVIVQGDTTTAFVTSLAAFYLGVKVGHVEAGLRTYNLQSPFPEELNRQMISKLASLHFAPTMRSVTNLTQEGVGIEQLLITGNTVVDAVNMIARRWKKTLPVMPDQLRELLADEKRKFIFTTCHRRESFGGPLDEICMALRVLSEKYSKYTWVFPVHLNPNVRDVVYRELGNIPNLYLMEPLEYEATLYLLSRSSLVLTDSGGIQEEAPSFAVPTVVMRNHTERLEGIESGFAVLAGTKAEDIISAAVEYLDADSLQAELAERPNPYGDGHAGRRIIKALQGETMEAFNAYAT